MFTQLEQERQLNYFPLRRKEIGLEIYLCLVLILVTLSLPQTMRCYWPFTNIMSNSCCSLQSVEHSYGLLCPSKWLHNKEFCKYWGYVNSFRFHFSRLAIPATVIANGVNVLANGDNDVSILRQMLASHPGPALYLHAAEVSTDALYNILTNFRSFFESTDDWRKTCAYYQYLSVFQLYVVTRQYLCLLNQAYLTGLVADRLYAMSKPIKYSSGGDEAMRKRGKLLLLKTFVACTLFYLPFIVYRAFHPTFLHWKEKTTTWKDLHDPFDAGVVTLYAIISIGFIIAQIIIGILFEKEYRKFLANRSELKSEKALKRKERDKRLLLVGTIGLNIITGTMNTLFNLINTTAFHDLNLVHKYPWWKHLFTIGDLSLVFVNGNGALFIHIMMVKSYRKAFKTTRLGRVLCGHKIQQQQVKKEENVENEIQEGPVRCGRED